MRRLAIQSVGAGGVLAIRSVFALWAYRAVVLPVVTVAAVLVALFASTCGSTREAWTDTHPVVVVDSPAAGHAGRFADGSTYRIRLMSAVAHGAAEGESAR